MVLMVNHLNQMVMSKVVGMMLLEGIFGSGRGNEEAFFSVLSSLSKKLFCS